MQQGIEVGFTEEAIEYLADLGFDPQFGARPLKRVIQREVINELSRRILANEVKSTERIQVDRFDHKGIVFRNIALEVAPV